MLIPDASIQNTYPNFEDFQTMIHTIVYNSDYLPLDISNELHKIKDLLEVSYFKIGLFEVAQLHCIMVFEKALRIKLYKAYKTITKIKFSVLLDKVLQLSLLPYEVVCQIRTLKDIRNKTVHHSTLLVDHTVCLCNIKLLIDALHTIFPIQEMYFIMREDIKIRYAYSLDEALNDLNKNGISYGPVEALKIIKLKINGSYEEI
jgi:hypothetical protein